MSIWHKPNECQLCGGNGRIYEHVQDDIGQTCYVCIGTGHTPAPQPAAPPKVHWEYVGEELAIFWESPYGRGKEKIANFWWPGHPPEATSEIERMFEEFAERLVLKPACAGYPDCDGDLPGQSHEPGCPAGAPTPVREGAAFTAKEFDAELWTERDPQNKLAFAEAFSAHQNAALRQEVDRLTDTFLACETIQPDGSLRATLKDVIRRAETAEAELESLRKERDALREKLN
jgi:hypothetical protein